LELLEREILDSSEIEKIINGEELPPIKRNGSAEEEKEIPEHVKKLMDQRKPKETSPQDDSI